MRHPTGSWGEAPSPHEAFDLEKKVAGRAKRSERSITQPLRYALQNQTGQLWPKNRPKRNEVNFVTDLVTDLVTNFFVCVALTKKFQEIAISWN